MKKLLLFFLSFLSLILPHSTKGQQSTFNKVFSRNDKELHAYSIARTPDNYYFISGSIDEDPFVCKMDSLANITWCRNFINSSFLTPFSVVTATKDSCVVLATSLPNPGNTRNIIFCAKINTNGDTIWTKAIDFGHSIEVSSITNTNDNGFILTGNFSSSEPDIKTVIVKLRSSGNIIWSNIYSVSPSSSCRSFSAQQTPDNGYIVTGSVQTSDTSWKMLLMKLNSSGSVSWVKRQLLPDEWNSTGFDVIVTSNGFLVGAFSTDYETPDILIKTDFMGNLLWNQIIGYNSGYNLWDLPTPRLHMTSDGGSVFSISYPDFGMGVFSKFDSSGNNQWEKRMILSITDFVESADRSFMVVGNGPVTVSSKVHSNYHIGILKNDSLGNSIHCVEDGWYFSQPFTYALTSDTISAEPGGNLVIFPVVIENFFVNSENACVDVYGSIETKEQEKNSLSIFPVPASDKITVESSIITEKTTISVINVNGQEVLRTFVQDKLSEIDIICLPPGIYYLRLWNEKNIQVGKIIIN